MWGKIKFVFGLFIGAIIFILYVLYGRERRKRIELQHKLKAQKVKAEMNKKKAEIEKRKAEIKKNDELYKKAVEKQKKAEEKIKEIDRKLEELRKRKEPKNIDEEWRKRGF